MDDPNKVATDYAKDLIQAMKVWDISRDHALLIVKKMNRIILSDNDWKKPIVPETTKGAKPN